MKIAVVMGFFLPVPPAAGGATEKSWHGLAVEFARRGHEVTVFSRHWPGWSNRSAELGVTHVRLHGYSHSGRLWLNLLKDLAWSIRAARALSPSDILVANCLSLPAFPRTLLRSSCRRVVMTGRMPKGQYRLYGGLERVLAVSESVRDAVAAENPKLASVIRVTGYPIDWAGLSRRSEAPASTGTVRVGFVGRIHREKGLLILAEAARILDQRSDLPLWSLEVRGPSDVARGGSGPAFVRQLAEAAGQAGGSDHWRLAEPVFGSAALASIYGQIDIFCYPSIADGGETFGVAVAEAMAAGAAPVVSDLACFRDFLSDGVTGKVFNHRRSNAAAGLADALGALILDTSRRQQLAKAAQAAVQKFDFPRYADRLLADFSSLTGMPAQI